MADTTLKRLNDTWNWVQSVLTPEEMEAIKARCKEQATQYLTAVQNNAKFAPSPFTTNASYFIKRDEAGKPVRDANGYYSVTGKFTIRGIASSRTAITKPIMGETVRGGKKIPLTFYEINASVLDEDHKKAAEFFYSSVISWALSTKQSLTPSTEKDETTGKPLIDFTKVFGNKTPVVATQKYDKETGAPLEGYWVNISLPVVVPAKTGGDPNKKFQLCSFGSRVPGKTLTPDNADLVLKPTEDNKGWIEITPDTHLNQGENDKGEAFWRCEFRAQRLVLIPSPIQSNYVSMEDIYAAQDAMDGYAEPAAAPTMASQAPTAPVAEPVVAPEQISPIDPSDADIEAIMNEISLGL